ncbi:hypothetical protein MYU51_009609 [Penicillium brevicompactum]
MSFRIIKVHGLMRRMMDLLTPYLLVKITSRRLRHRRWAEDDHRIPHSNDCYSDREPIHEKNDKCIHKFEEHHPILPAVPNTYDSFACSATKQTRFRRLLRNRQFALYITAGPPKTDRMASTEISSL